MEVVKPVLVTGAPRTGTTWVGRMLAASPDLYYVHEPFNPDFPPGNGVCNVKFSHHQTYITEANEDKYRRPIRHMLGGKFNISAALLESRSLEDVKKVMSQKKRFEEYGHMGMRPLIKDPIALMSAGWLAKRFDLAVIMMIRHPAGFVASMNRLEWGFDPTRWALSQPLLLKDYLAPLEEELIRLRDSEADLVEQNALFWKIAYSVVLKYKEHFPNWMYLRHEDIANDPMNTYRHIFDQLGLHFTDDVKKQIFESSNATNPPSSTGSEKLLKLNSKSVTTQWKKILTAEQVMKIREIVGDVSDKFYSDDDWALDTD